MESNNNNKNNSPTLPRHMCVRFIIEAFKTMYTYHNMVIGMRVIRLCRAVLYWCCAFDGLQADKSNVPDTTKMCNIIPIPWNVLRDCRCNMPVWLLLLLLLEYHKTFQQIIWTSAGSAKMDNSCALDNCTRILILAGKSCSSDTNGIHHLGCDCCKWHLCTHKVELSTTFTCTTPCYNRHAKAWHQHPGEIQATFCLNVRGNIHLSPPHLDAQRQVSQGKHAHHSIGPCPRDPWTTAWHYFKVLAMHSGNSCDLNKRAHRYLDRYSRIKTMNRANIRWFLHCHIIRLFSSLSLSRRMLVPADLCSRHKPKQSSKVALPLV